jgi:hypothetical protein
LLDKFVDLIYLDPLFFSNKYYDIIFNGEEIRSFEDQWKGGIEHHVKWMKGENEKRGKNAKQ